MIYLLDANVLIDANRDYYPLVRVPEFWEWLEYNGSEGHIKLPLEIYEEITPGDDDFAKWLKNAEIKESLLLDEAVDPDLVSKIVNDSYAPDLTDVEVGKIGRDPFLIAYALADLGNRTVVTTEGPKSKTKRANRHVPDVCKDFGIPSCNTYALVRELDFRTGWNAGR